GVAINSTIPGDDWLQVSGTSQAAPYVSRVAGEVKNINKSLTVAEVKKIIMETVDKKDFLTGKVKAEGVVNEERAYYAAKLSKRYNLDQALSLSNQAVGDY